MPQEIIKLLKPTHTHPIRELIELAGVDVAAWAIDKNDRAIENPNLNTHRNSQWTFGGSDQPLVICVWWEDLKVDGLDVIHEDSIKEFAEKLGNELAAPDRKTGEAKRLRNKIDKARAFDRAIYEAYSKRKPLRMVVLDGYSEDAADAAYVSSKTSKRLLDRGTWFVHSYEPYSGKYRLVREVPMPTILAIDPFDGAEDPAADPIFQHFLNESSITDTEKDALIKIRVGQGWFRDALCKRWGGCAVTDCKDYSLLIASHIVPWRDCTTRAERLGAANGLLLTPNLDKAFDQGLISFDNAFKILISTQLSKNNEIALNINPGMALRIRSFDDMRPFLKRHRENVFQGPAKKRL